MEKKDKKDKKEIENKLKRDRMYMGGRITTNDC